MEDNAQSVMLTADDYLLMPEGGPRYQLVEGELSQMPSPSDLHQAIVTNLVIIIGMFLRTTSLGKLRVAPLDVYLDDVNVFQPDILFLSNERLGLLSERGVEGAPDFVVEVLSPRTARLDVGPKRRTYERHGVKEYWLIDPNGQTVTVYRGDLGGDHPVGVFSRDAVLETPLLPGFRVTCRELFAK